MQAEEFSGSSRRLAVLLAMAMLVLVVDTSLMNVSIGSVVEDLDTTVSGVQGAIALEALVSAAFILIGSKVGDLIGRKRAFVLGLLGYALGALAMTLTQSLTAVIVFWAIIGGLGASMLLPAMQSLIHGNFEGAAHKQGLRARRRGGRDRRRRRAAARRLPHDLPLVAGGFVLEVVVIAVVLPEAVRTCPTRPAQDRRGGAVLSAVGMGGVVIGILVWQEGGEYVGALIAVGAVSWVLSRRLVRRKREGKPTLLDPDLFKLDLFRLGISSQMLQNIALGGLMIALPIYLQMVLEYNADGDGPDDRAAVADDVRDGAAGRAQGGGPARPAGIIRLGAALLSAGVILLAPDRPAR